MSNWRDKQRNLVIEQRNETRQKIGFLKSGLYSAKNIKLLFDPFLLRENEYWGFLQQMIEPIGESGCVEINMTLINFRDHELGSKYIDVSTRRNSSGLIPILKIINK
jgi:hypothetical protein